MKVILFLNIPIDQKYWCNYCKCISQYQIAAFFSLNKCKVYTTNHYVCFWIGTLRCKKQEKREGDKVEEDDDQEGEEEEKEKEEEENGEGKKEIKKNKRYEEDSLKLFFFK